MSSAHPHTHILSPSLTHTQTHTHTFRSLKHEGSSIQCRVSGWYLFTSATSSRLQMQWCWVVAIGDAWLVYGSRGLDSQCFRTHLFSRSRGVGLFEADFFPMYARIFAVIFAAIGSGHAGIICPQVGAAGPGPVVIFIRIHWHSGAGLSCLDPSSTQTNSGSRASCTETHTACCCGVPGCTWSMAPLLLLSFADINIPLSSF